MRAKSPANRNAAPARKAPSGGTDRKPVSLRDGDGVDERLFVASVEKAMKILETYSRDVRSLSISDIAARTGIGRSATQRFIYTLERLGYLRRDPVTKQYALAPKVFGFAHSALSANSALDNAFHALTQLGEKTRETVSWVELDGDSIVILGNVPSSHLTSINLPVGTRFPAVTSSSGQCILAYGAPSHIEQMFNRADSSALDRLGRISTEQFLALLEQVKKSGYAITEKSPEQGSLSVSAPIFDYVGRPIAAINLSTLTTRFTREQARKTLVPLVVEAAKVASSFVGR
jgi:IclR family pca regulon transcriptional regulator